MVEWLDGMKVGMMVVKKAETKAGLRAVKLAAKKVVKKVDWMVV